jgi:L-serine dehydratase
VNTSLFELFKIGIGPSSSHTVGPMRAALRFARELAAADQLDRTASVCIELYGSLALTGLGHGTDRAILLGLSGQAPDTVDPTAVEGLLAAIRSHGELALNGSHRIVFREPEHLLFHRDQMYPPPGKTTHPNGLRLSAFDSTGTRLRDQVFYSVGGGFIVSAKEFHPESAMAPSSRSVPHPFRSARDLLAEADLHHLSIADLVMENELALLAAEAGTAGINRPSGGDPASTTPQLQIENSVLILFEIMRSSAERGIAIEGILPGGLNVRRRAHRLAARLGDKSSADPLAPMDWVTVYAMAVNEENAAGGRVVTAPTNGAAGVIPAIALYLLHHVDAASLKTITTGSPVPSTQDEAALSAAHRSALLRFFLTAAAIGILYKENASISGAEVGCQGEVGVACSMAAGGLVAALGGSNAQIEHAAEIAMEHNLGMTCDPIGGLVQIPCIERNGMGAVKAINAARLALADTDTHKLSLDQVIETMYRTGLDMQSRYKETSLGGLALNIIEC